MSEPKQIERWAVEDHHGVFQPPESDQHVNLSGEVEGRDKPMLTTRIVSSDGRVVTTRSGSRYRLGAPSIAYQRWLEVNGLELDEGQPIKVLPPIWKGGTTP